MFFNKTATLLKKAEQDLLLSQTELQQTKNELSQIRSMLVSTESKLAQFQQTAEVVRQENETLTKKYAPLINFDKTLDEKKEELEVTETTLQELNKKYQAGLEIYTGLEKKIALYQESLDLTEYGLYVSKYSFELPEQYKLELESVYQKQKQMVTNETAAKCATEWTVGGSSAEGKKMTKHYTKLMLYAFNGECDAQIANIKWNNVAKIEERIRHAFVNINKLGNTHKISLTQDFLDLKLQEMALIYEYEQKKFEEKEEQRRIREQMREEEKAQRDFERAQKEAEDEERRYQKALEKAKQELNDNNNGQNVEALMESVKLLEKRLQEAQERKERAISMAQLTKAGHIYIISNIGSFGEDVYKIGMTRRLDPSDRIRELSDASVPFYFDVHATIYSENAPQLEYDLHQKFKERRLNRVNTRKEFFRITLEEIEHFVKEHTKAEIVFTKLAEAREYRETMALHEALLRAAQKAEAGPEMPASLL